MSAFICTNKGGAGVMTQQGKALVTVATQVQSPYSEMGTETNVCLGYTRPYLFCFDKH